MNDQEDKKKSENEQQPSADEAVRAEPGEVSDESPPATTEPDGIDAGVMLVDRPPRRGTIELKGPPGMAVSLSGDEWCTKIVIHLAVGDLGEWTP